MLLLGFDKVIPRSAKCRIRLTVGGGDSLKQIPVASVGSTSLLVSLMESLVR